MPRVFDDEPADNSALPSVLAVILAALMISSLGWAAGNVALSVLDVHLAPASWADGRPQDYEMVL